MSKKRKLKKNNKLIISGIILVLIGIISLINLLQITGFVIRESMNPKNTIIIPIIVIAIGIILATSGNSLQEWLEKKEKNRKSPSLEGKLQTPEEERMFRKRYSGKKSFFKGLVGKTHVEQVPQKDLFKYKKGDYQDQESENFFENMEKRSRIRDAEQERATYERNLKENMEEIPKLRKKLMNLKKEIDKNAESGEYNAKEWKKYMEASIELQQVYGEINIPFSSERYKVLKSKKAKQAFSKAKQNLNQGIIGNKFPFGYSGTGEVGRRLEALKELESEAGSKQEIQDIRELEKLYVEQTSTVSISEASKKYGVVFIHNIPWKSFSRNTQLGFNYALTKEQREEGDAKDFLEIIKNKKPMLSSSSYSKNSRDIFSVSPFGIIFKEGEIFDASPNDFASRGLPNKSRFRNWADSKEVKEDINKRLERAIQYKGNKGHGSARYNEIIIGGDYEIGGLYYNEENYSNTIYDKDRNENLRFIAQEAEKLQVPLYMLTSEGMQEVNPKDYLKKPKKHIESTKRIRTKRKAVV